MATVEDAGGDIVVRFSAASVQVYILVDAIWKDDSSNAKVVNESKSEIASKRNREDERAVDLLFVLGLTAAEEYLTN